MCTTCSPPLPWAITVCGIFRLSAAFSSSSSRSPINSSPHAPLQSHFGVKLHCGGLPNKTSAWLISIGPRLCPMQSLKKSGCRWRTGFIRPFEIVHIINLSAIHLKLPAAMKIHPSFNVSQIKTFSSSVLWLLPSLLTQLVDNCPILIHSQDCGRLAAGWGSSVSGGLRGLWSGGKMLDSPVFHYGSFPFIGLHRAHPGKPGSRHWAGIYSFPGCLHPLSDKVVFLIVSLVYASFSSTLSPFHSSFPDVSWFLVILSTVSSSSSDSFSETVIVTCSCNRLPTLHHNFRVP